MIKSWGGKYQLVTISASQKSLKKLPKPVRKHILQIAQKLSDHPYDGEQLHGQWNFLRSLHTVYRKTHYRIVYQVDEHNKQIVIRYVAPRENLYKILRHMNIKRL